MATYSGPVLTYSGPVLSHKPQMVAEKWQDADKEQGRHEKQKQDVEFGVRVSQLFLQRGKGEQKCQSCQSARRFPVLVSSHLYPTTDCGTVVNILLLLYNIPPLHRTVS